MRTDKAALTQRLKKMRQAGMTLREIAEATGMSLTAVNHRLNPETYCRTRAMVIKTPRPCLCCGNTFMSEGAHNRLCASCRDRAARISPWALYIE